MAFGLRLLISVVAVVKDNRKEEHIITPLVEFAVALMSSLDQINRDAFQRFKLRLGKFA